MGSFFQRIIFNATLILGVAAIILILSRRSIKNRHSIKNKFLEEEMEANAARKKDIEPEFFYYPTLDSLPLHEDADGEIKKKQEIVKKHANLTMIYFPKKPTNLELKKAYGRANLEKITGYEENYSRYISSLVSWANALIENGGEGQKDDAINILENTVKLGSEFSKTYMLLADHYKNQDNIEGLNHLLDKINVAIADNGIRHRLVQYIMDKKESL